MRTLPKTKQYVGKSRKHFFCAGKTHTGPVLGSTHVLGVFVAKVGQICLRVLFLAAGLVHAGLDPSFSHISGAQQNRAALIPAILRGCLDVSSHAP